jgi:hypothetical protein
MTVEQRESAFIFIPSKRSLLSPIYDTKGEKVPLEGILSFSFTPTVGAGSLSDKLTSPD